jgi:hypothetical protein
MIKMKTNKQNMVILMLLVIPTTLTIVTSTTTTQQAVAKSGNNRGQTGASRDTQGLNDNGVPTDDIKQSFIHDYKICYSDNIQR